MSEPVGAIHLDVISDMGAFATSTEAKIKSATATMGAQIDREMQAITAKSGEHGAAAGSAYTRGRDGRLRDGRGRFVLENEKAGAEGAAVMGRAGEKAGRNYGDKLGGGVRKALNSALGTNLTGPVFAAAALAAIGVASVKMAGTFEASMVRLVTAAGESHDALRMVSSGVLAVARDTGTGTHQLGDAMYMIESAGFHGAAALNIVRAAAEGAKVDMADTGVVANALTTAMVDLHAPTDQAATIMSQLVAAVGHGKMTMDDLASSLHSVLPNAVAIGLSFGETAGAISTMTAQGISAQQATQNLNHAILSLANPTAVQTKTMAAYGLNASLVARDLGKKGLSGTLEELYHSIMSHMGPAGLTLQNALNQSQIAGDKATKMFAVLDAGSQKAAKGYMDGSLTAGEYRKTLAKMTGEQANLSRQWLTTYNRAHGFNDLLRSGSPEAQTFSAALARMTGGQVGLQVALHLTGENMTTYKANIAAVSAAHAEAGNHVLDWATKQKTFNQQMSQLKQTVVTAFIAIGMQLLPVLTQVATFINDYVVPAIGVLIRVLRDDLGPPLRVIGDVLGAVYRFMDENRATVAAFAITLGILALAFSYNTIVVKTYYAWIRIMTAAQAAWNLVMDANPLMILALAIAALVAGVVYAYGHFEAFRNIVDDVGRVLRVVFIAALNAVKTAVSDVVDWVRDHWKLLAIIIAVAALPITIAVGVIGGAIYLLVKHFRDIIDAATSAWRAVTSTFNAIKDAIVGSVTTAWHAVVNTFNAIKDAVVGFVMSVVNYVAVHWRLLLVLMTGPIGLVIVILIDHIKQITGLFVRLWNDVAGIVAKLWHAVSDYFLAIWRDVVHYTLLTWHGVVDPWVRLGRDVATLATRLWRDVTGIVTRLWRDVTGIATRLWRDVVHYAVLLWHGVVDPWVRLGADVWNIVQALAARVTLGFQRFRDQVTGIASNIWHGVVAVFGHLKDGVVAAFNGTVTAAGVAWDKVRDIIAKPIRWVVDNVYDKGIVKIWNGIAGVLHEDSMKLAPIHFSQGGMVPGSRAAGDNIPIYATAGEGVVNLSGMKAIGGQAGLSAINGNTHSGGAGSHFLLGGGVLGNIGHAVGGAVGAAAGVVGDIAGAVAHLARGALAATVSPAIHHLESMADSALGRDGMGGVADRMVHHVGDAIIDFVKGDDQKFKTQMAAAGGGAVTGDHLALIMQALGLAGVPQTAGNAADVDLIVRFESGWNPNAINLTDSNFLAGHPSQGLMQTIPSTFAAWALPGLGGITDPLANLVAGIRYAVNRYGSLDGVPGVAGVHSGGGYVGYDSGGVLHPGFTPAINNTGQDEYVLTSNQMERLIAAVERGHILVADNRQLAASARTGDARNGRFS